MESRSYSLLLWLGYGQLMEAEEEPHRRRSSSQAAPNEFVIRKCGTDREKC